MKSWSWKRWIWPAGLLLAATLWFVNRDDGTIKWSQFYNLNVELEHLGKPLNLHVVISCGSVGRQILGEGRSARSYWAPYIFGIEDQGHGVLVQTPGICGRDFAKHPIPEDYMPVLFWAPEAKNLEFMIAYLHEDAYAQPVSKLKFRKATITNATQAENDKWRDTTWKSNIVPLARVIDDHRLNATYFRSPAHYAGSLGDLYKRAAGEDVARRSMFPPGDPRNLAEGHSCKSLAKFPLTQHLSDWIRSYWPDSKPRFWILNREIYGARAATPSFNGELFEEAWRRGFKSIQDESRYGSAGVARRSGAGTLRGDIEKLRGTGYGLADRIPYRSSTGYPWINREQLSRKFVEITIDTNSGAASGFGYCYRDVWQALLAMPKDPLREFRFAEPHKQAIIIDANIVAEIFDSRTPEQPFHIIVERDEFLWLEQSIFLESETARNQ